MSHGVKRLALSEGGGGRELAPEPALGEKAASEQMGSLAQMGKDTGCKTVWFPGYQLLRDAWVCVAVI